MSRCVSLQVITRPGLEPHPGLAQVGGRVDQRGVNGEMVGLGGGFITILLCSSRLTYIYTAHQT
jgi:hypothetical protein